MTARTKQEIEMVMVRGMVVDHEGKGIDGVQVLLEQEMTTTDDGGLYEFAVKELGTYRLCFWPTWCLPDEDPLELATPSYVDLELVEYGDPHQVPLACYVPSCLLLLVGNGFAELLRLLAKTVPKVPTAARISGYVFSQDTDGTSILMDGVPVTLVRPDATALRVKTDRDGYYEFKVEDEGSYRVQFFETHCCTETGETYLLDTEAEVEVKLENLTDHQLADTHYRPLPAEELEQVMLATIHQAEQAAQRVMTLDVLATDPHLHEQMGQVHQQLKNEETVLARRIRELKPGATLHPADMTRFKDNLTAVWKRSNSLARVLAIRIEQSSGQARNQYKAIHMHWSHFQDQVANCLEIVGIPVGRG